ncbi:hypothetical protein Dimus_021491 [Dionaea muscipula]
MSSSSKSKSKDKKAGKEQKASPKASGTVNGASGIPTSAYNPILGTFHTLETSSTSSAPSLHVNGRFRNIEEPDDHSGSINGSGGDYDSASNNDSRSVESEEKKEKIPNASAKQEVIPGADNEKREKIRQKNERKHQRQKERRAQELHERCSGYLMSRKLEALAQQLVGMGFSAERATLALILNEGKVEEAVAWLFEAVEEADRQIDQDLDTGGNLNIDITKELARIAELEIMFKCSKQDVERAIVACEGDLDKAEEMLGSQKQEPLSAIPKSEEASESSPSLSNGKISLIVNQSSLRPQLKPGSTSILQPKRDEKDFNYTKGAVTVGPTLKSVSKNLLPLTRIQQKIEWTRPQQAGTPPAEKRWSGGGGSSPTVSYPLTSPLQVSPLPAKSESRYVPVSSSEFKIMQPGMVREPVVVMQRPQSVNAKQAAVPVANISLSPPGTTAASAWYPTNSEVLKPNGLLPHHIPSTRSSSPNNLSSNNHFYQQPNYHHQQQFLSGGGGGGSLDPPATTTRGNTWTRMGTSPPPLAAASSLGLFSGFTSTCSSGSNSPVDWNSGGSIPSCDYNNIDWSLDRSVLPPRPNGMWVGLNSFQKSNSHIYDLNKMVKGVKPTTMRPPSSSESGVSFGGLQEGAAATADTSSVVSHEWTSPFEGKDLFSLPRQFVSSPSL